MYSSQIITYVFRQADSNDLLKANEGTLPKDYFYFYHFLNRDLLIRSISSYSNKFFRLINIVTDHISHFFLRFDFPLLNMFPYIYDFNNSKIIYATTPKIGLALSLLKKLKLVKSHLIVNIVGFYDQLIQLDSPHLQALSRSLFTEVNHFISGASLHEAKMLSKYLNIPLEKFTFLPYSGIDTDFFLPSKQKNSNFILGVGNDPARDWQLYKQIAQALPNELFVWATNPSDISFTIPSNVTVKYLSTSSFRKHLQNTKLVLILTKFNHHFSGQASALRAMSCGKTVIMTQTPGSDEFNIKNACIFVKPGKSIEIVAAIKRITQNQKLRMKMEKAARKTIVSRYSYEKIGHKYVSFFKKILNETY